MSDIEGVIEICKCCFCKKFKNKSEYNPKCLCDCGKIVNLLSMFRHKQTKIHINWTLGIKQRKTKYQSEKERKLKILEPKSPKYTIDNTLMSLAF